MFETDIEYANPDGQHLQLDLARPEGRRRARSRRSSASTAAASAPAPRRATTACASSSPQQGYVAVTVSYRLAPKYPFPAAVHDVKAAVRWLRANAGEVPHRPGPHRRHRRLGRRPPGAVPRRDGRRASSSRATAATPDQSSRVACVVNVYGPSDFTKSYGKSVDAAEVLPLFLGGDLETGPAPAHPGQPALLGDAERRPDAVHPRHGGQVRRPRAGGLAGRPAQGGGRGGRAADAGGRRPRLQGRGRRRRRQGPVRVLRQAFEGSDFP